MADMQIDLFGLPVVVRHRGRGRPKHERTERNANRVKSLLALGRKQAEIARMLNISEPVLRREYFAELKLRDMARLAAELEVFELAQEQARQGNVGAMKFVDKKLSDADVKAADRRVNDAQADQTEKPEKLGKKEAALKAARETAATGWGSDLDFGGRPVN